jgi:hypothetical protein
MVYSAFPSDGKPAPALLSPGTPRAIREALIDAERTEFEQRFAEAMAEAARTLDLTEVIGVLDQAARLQRGDTVPTVAGNIHKAKINARLRHCCLRHSGRPASRCRG